jgi:hypothetical protein
MKLVWLSDLHLEYAAQGRLLLRLNEEVSTE